MIRHNISKVCGQYSEPLVYYSHMCHFSVVIIHCLWSWKLAHVSSIQLVGCIIAGSTVFISSLIYSVGPGQQYALNEDCWKTIVEAVWYFWNISSSYLPILVYAVTIVTVCTECYHTWPTEEWRWSDGVMSWGQCWYMYKSNFIYSQKKSMAFPTLIFTKT